MCSHIDNLVVAAKGKEKFPVNDMVRVVKTTQTAFLDSLVERFDMQ